jgi:hypothetical protein
VLALGLALGPVAALAQAAAAPAPASAPAPAPAPAKAAGTAHGLGDTRCASCHTTSTWKNVQFDHSQTGFLLKGAHQKAGCFGCHAQNLSQPVPLACAACHQDAHRGEFGQRCAGCHQEESWKTTFTADAHRMTGFPLVGRHAFISCEECHGNKRDRTFTRAGAASCASCHSADFKAAAGKSVDHVAFGFSQQCRDCHTPTSFKAARFADHEKCFQIAGGPHGGIACLNCHSSLLVPATPGACLTFTAHCTGCHEHEQARTDSIHLRPSDKYPSGVPAYQYKDRKCYECHLFSTPKTTPLRGPRSSASTGRQ